MIIRKAINSDFDSIANLHIESWQNSYSDVLPSEFLESKIIPSLKEHWRNIKISDDDVVLIAEKREIIGFIAVWCRPTPFIDNLHVKPSHRSHNVGTTLMKAAAEELIKKGNTRGFISGFLLIMRPLSSFMRNSAVSRKNLRLKTYLVMKC